MRAAIAFTAALAATASARRCGPRASSATLAVTSTTVSSTPLSTDIPTSTETPSSTIIVETSTSSSSVDTSTSTSSADTSTSTSSADTPTSTTSADSSTSSTAPAPTPTVLGFCLKAVTPGVVNYGSRVNFVGVTANLVMAPRTNPSYPNPAYFNIDMSTGALTLNMTAFANYQVYLPGPFDNQNFRVIRVTTAPANPLTCFNPDGQYTSGSVLKCSGSGAWSSGLKTYNTLAWSSSGSTAAWQIRLDGYQSGTSTAYDVAMFFGSDCL